MKNSNNIKKIVPHLIVFSILFVPMLFVDAQAAKKGPVFSNPLGEGNNVSVFALITALADFVLQLLSAFVVLVIIYAGFLFVTAGGSDDKISKAKKFFMWAIIGGVVILAANAISGLICNTLEPFGAVCNRN